MMGQARLRLAGLLFCAALLAPASADSAPEAELWPRWQAHSPGVIAAIDHGAWDHFLARYAGRGTDGIVRLAYGRVTAEDRRKLDAYIGGLAATAIDGFDRPEQEAFWINLYNALTVRTVLDRYPVRSIRDIDTSPGLFQDGPWGEILVLVEGEKLSLDDIEHRILRPIWHDPRLHYALNCAALGCPDLQLRAFTAAGMAAQLDEAARAYVNHPRGARIEDGDLVVSSVYVWYEKDFGNSEAAVIAHLRRYGNDPLRRALEGRAEIDGDDYDWALNDAR